MRAGCRPGNIRFRQVRQTLVLTRLFFHFEAFAHESIIRVLPPPPYLHCPHHRNTAARILRKIRPSPRPPFCIPSTIHYWQWQYRVEAKVRQTRCVCMHRVSLSLCVRVRVCVRGACVRACVYACVHVRVVRACVYVCVRQTRCVCLCACVCMCCVSLSVCVCV